MINRFERVVQILDESIGGPDAGIGVHGAFWRVDRDQFVAKRVSGRDVLIVGQGASSPLVKALKGEAPFGVDLPDPPPGAVLGRMPLGRSPVPAEDIAFIERWIDEGCLEDPLPAVPTWRPTSATPVDSRYDDVFFLTPELGWAVNSDARIVHTNDGGGTWQTQLEVGLEHPNVYLRCVGFASESRGWVGTVTSGTQLFETADGGATWSLVTDLPELAPSAICGLCVLNESVVYAAGTNYPYPNYDLRPPRMMKTTDGGATWTAWDMTAHAALLVDAYFTSPDRGWVVGAKADPAVPPGDNRRGNVKPVVLYTEDGGQTWVNRVADLEDEFPWGEWGWKIHFVDAQVGFVSLENFTAGAVLKTTDGGQTWTRLEITDPQRNANLEGVGFVTQDVGWAGGWGSADFKGGYTSETRDGGRTWRDANEVGRFINRFRFFPGPVGYAAGRTIFKYSSEPAPAPAAIAAPGPRLLDTNEPLESVGPVPIQVTVPSGASHLAINIWERFGDHVRQLVDEPSPVAGPRTFEWDVADDAGEPLRSEGFIVRVTVDGESESRIVAAKP